MSDERLVTTPRPPRHRRARRAPVPAAPLFGPLAVVLIGLVLVVVAGYRTGLVVVAAALLLAAGMRGALPGARSGLLTARGRGLDTVLLAGAAIAVLVLATTLPGGSG